MNNADEAAVRTIEQREVDLMLAADLEGLSTLWSETLIVNNPANFVVGRQQVLDMVRSGIIGYLSFERTCEAINVVGDTAIAMGQEIVTEAQGAAREGKTVTRRYTNVWRRTSEGWKLIGRQATILSVV